MKPIECTNCDGTGVFVNLYHPIPRSMGNGKSVCGVCNGRGYRQYVYAEGERFMVREIEGKPGQFEYVRS